MISTALLLMLLLLEQGSVRAEQCYVGKDTFEAHNVTIPICSFKITYSDDDCSAQPNVVLAEGPETQIVNFNKERNSICYVEEMQLLCYCRGHLCNDDKSVKKTLTPSPFPNKSSCKQEILARELAHGATENLKKLVTCFLLHAGFTCLMIKEAYLDGGDGYIRQRIQGQEVSKHEFRGLPIMFKKTPPEEKKTNWFLFIAGAAVVIIFADLILLFLIFFVVMKKRRLRNGGNKSDSKKLPKKSLDPNKPQYPFPEFSGMSGRGSGFGTLSDAEGVKRIDEVIKREEEEEES